MAMIFDDRDEERYDKPGERRQDFEHGPDFARGQRTDPSEPDASHPDFARGEDQELAATALQGPDFARGQREDPDLPDVEGPDFARGQHEEDLESENR